MAYDETLAARVRALLADCPDVTERRMFGGLTFMVAGHMCCGVHGDQLILRLGPEGAAEALTGRRARPMDFTGRALTGFARLTAKAWVVTRWRGESVRLLLGRTRCRPSNANDGRDKPVSAPDRASRGPGTRRSLRTTCTVREAGVPLLHPQPERA